MAQRHYTYKESGVPGSYISQQVPGTGSVLEAVPIRLQTIVWDETYKADLDAAMSSAGWSYLYEGDAPGAKTIAQSVTGYLAADAASIATADGWVNVKSVSLTSQGGSVAASFVVAIGNTGSGQGQARVLVNGGSYSNQVVGAAQYDIHNSNYGATGFNIPVPLADTSPTDTTYTFTLQFSVTGVGATIIPRAGSGISLAEYR